MTIPEPFEPVARVVATDEPQSDLDSKTGLTADDRVGYGRPPRATRFVPGKSGNPKGRPKGARSVGAILQRWSQEQDSTKDLFNSRVTSEPP